MAFWGAVLTTDAQSARQPGAVTRERPLRSPPVETDADRRARLEARIADWTRTARKPVLPDEARARVAALRTDTARVLPEATAGRRDPVGTPRPAARRVVETRASGRSTIEPPPPTSAAIRLDGARGYRPPRLDLVNMPRVPTDPIECLTQAIYYEARNESEEGQAAVAEVVINRSRAGNYPRDICQVVFQRNSRTCQFTFTCDGSIGRGRVNPAAWSRAEKIAREVHAGRTPLLPGTSVNYHANYVRPSWGQRLQKVRQIGAHIFYGRALNGSTPGSAPMPVDRPSGGGLTFTSVAALDQAYAALMASEPGESPQTP